jgi:two-component system, sensor histidine kinase and response regulator
MQKKHILLFIVLFLLAVFQLTAYAESQSPTTQSDANELEFTPIEQTWLKDHSVLKVHNEMTWPPFNFNENSVPKGLSIDYMNLIAEKIGIDVEYVSGPTWNEFLGMMKAKELDVMLNIVKTDDRLKYLLFTDPYTKNPNIIVSRMDNPYNDIEDLKEGYVALPKGFFYEEVINKKFPEIDLKLFDNTLFCLKAVETGEVNATFCESAVANYLITHNLLTNLHISGLVSLGNEDFENLRMAVSNDQPVLHSILKKASMSITENELQNIYKKWLVLSSEQVLSQSNESSRYQIKIFLWIGLIFVISILLIFFVLRSFTKLPGKNKEFKLQSNKYIIVSIMALFLAMTITITWIALNKVKSNTIKQTENSLQTVLNISDETILLWLNHQLEQLEYLAANPLTVELVKNLLQDPIDNESLSNNTTLEKLRKHVINSGELTKNVGFFIINPDYINIGSMRNTNLGDINQIYKLRPTLLEETFSGKSNFIPPIFTDLDNSSHEATMFYAAPVRDENNKVIAVMTIRENPLEEFSKICQISRLGKSGETYAFDGNGILISNSRFDDQLQEIGLLEKGKLSILNIVLKDPGGNLTKGYHPEILPENQPFTEMTRNGINGESGTNLTGYRDYRGIEVYGTWKWHRNLNFGIALEIDKKEALSSYLLTRTIILTILIIIVFLAIASTIISILMGERSNKILKTANEELESRVEERTLSLAQSEERSRSILESAGEGIFGVDSQGKATFVNPAAIKILGYTEDGILGKSVHHLFHHSHADGTDYDVKECPMYKTFTIGLSQQEINEVLWRNDGSMVPVEYTTTPIYSKDELSGAVITFRDVTERREQEEKSRKLLTALENNPVMVSITDPKGIVQYVNPEYTRVTGFTSDDVIGKRHSLLKSGIISEAKYQDVYDTIMADNTWKGELQSKHKDGTKFWARLLVSGILTDQGILTNLVINEEDIDLQKKTELEIEKAKESFEYAAEVARLGHWELDLQTMEFTFNEQFFSLLGTTEELEGGSIMPAADYLAKYVHPDDIGLLQTKITEAAAGKEGYKDQFEYRVIERDKEIQNVFVKYSVKKHKDKAIVTGIHLDITDRKNMEAELDSEREKLQTILDSSPVAVAVSSDAIMRYSNDRFEDLFGVKKGDKTPQNYVNVEDHNFIIKELKKNRSVTNYYLQAYGKHNEILDLMVNYYLTEYENRNSILAWLVDITQLKKIENELMEAKVTAEMATQAKGDFLANMSHEIRTPMNAILGLNHLQMKTKMTGKQKDYGQKIGRAAQNLLGIINDILDFSKIEAGKIEIESIDFSLDGVLDNVSNLMNVKAQQKNLELIVSRNGEIPDDLIGDPLRLSQVLTNLTTNAIKFTDKGEIEIKVEIIEQIDSKLKLKFCVRDTGIGLTEEQSGKLFQSFQQADTSTTRKYGGTGLGLTISKKLVELMNGEIGVTSIPEVGSTFYFTTVLGVSQQKKKKCQIIPEFLNNMKVLIVDDNETVRELLSSYCEDFSFSVESCNDGREAITFLHENKEVSLVLMDWKMPVMDGVEACRRIQADKFIDPKPKLIMITGYGREDIIKQSEEIGLDGFLIKPVGQSLLLDAILEAFDAGMICDGIAAQNGKNAKALLSIRGASILLVEDNEINQQVAYELLESVGFKVTVVSDGKQAVDIVNERGHDFELVLMDLQMPVMDGYEATEKIRKNKDFDDLPIVAMTADAMLGVEEKVLSIGMSDYITKPIDVEELYGRLIKWLKPRDIIEGVISTPEKVETVDIPLEIEGIDIASALKRVGGNKKLFLRILSQFKDNNQNFAEKVISAVKAKDQELAVRLAHSLKGVSGNIGAQDIFLKTKTLEGMLKASIDHIEPVEAELVIVTAMLKQLFTGIAAITEKRETIPQTGGNIDIQLAKTQIVKLKDSLDNYNADSYDVFSELKDNIHGCGYDVELLEMEQQISSYDYEETLNTLQKIENKFDEEQKG